VTGLGAAALVSLLVAAPPDAASHPEEPAAESVKVTPVVTEPTDAPSGTPAPRRTVRIMPLGDSITSGNDDWSSDGYRRELGDRLAAAGLKYDFVGSLRAGTGADRDHEGHGGWTIDQVRAKINRWLVTYRPEVVLLNLGTNDMIKNVASEQAPARLSALLDAILGSSPDIRVVVAKVSPVPGTARPGWSPRLPKIAPRMVAYNGAIPAVVASKGPRASLVDMSRVSWADTKDGIHPTPAGYRQMADLWYQRLSTVLPGGDRWSAIAGTPYR
jgi:lysophospholipase L1-like esterase